MSSSTSATGARPKLPLLALGALGVVYGDIGTSPLYSMRETFESPHHDLAFNDANILGVLSLITWSLIIIITFKYLAFVMRADNQGEGGILALTSLVPQKAPDKARSRRFARSRWVLILIGLFGTALLYGDGMITPAISVLSAVEGTALINPAMKDFVVPIAVVILVILFAVQPRGTAKIGRVFGPIMVVWFITLAVLGVTHIVGNPSVLAGLNPIHAFEFFVNNKFNGFLALGSVFLVVTGGEALYADMGHFGRSPIKLGWFVLVLPALLLNYFGQGALLMAEPSAIENPFYRLAPEWALYPLVGLATMATVIASQALISGAFSMTMQATQLGYSPRVRIRHTSETEAGQIYVPAINWALMIACIGLVIGFRSSTNLAAAYGLAVTATMVITTMLFFVVARERMGWSLTKAVVACGIFIVIDLGFLGANVFKIPYGGWFPLVIGAAVFTMLTTWRKGRELVADRLARNKIALTDFAANIEASPPTRVSGDAVYLYSTPDQTPPSLAANLRHNHALHERVVVLSILTEQVPRVAPEDRLDIVELGNGLYRLTGHYGFLEDPNIPELFEAANDRDFAIDMDDVTYFLGREALRVTRAPGMARWREHLFAFMSRNATPAANYFSLPMDQTIEVGVQVEL